MDANYLIEGPITPEIIINSISQLTAGKDSGGHSIFLGQVRADDVNGKRVTAIEYSAYAEMVKIEAAKIKNEILSEFCDAQSIVILHSTGMVNSGEISLLVLVSAGHRVHAIEACSKVVDLIKARLPVWKKEIFNDNSHEWKQNTSH